jgi:hypothetical protein
MKPCFFLSLLMSAAFTLATLLAPKFDDASVARSREAAGFTAFLAQSKRLFAEQSFVKADKYFHSGYYPTMFDDQTAFHTPHMALYPNVIDQEKRAEQARNKQRLQNVVDLTDESGSPGMARDWIEEFGRNFFPVRHTHLDQHGAKGEMRELLPWLKLAAELDPSRVEVFVVTAFWLRTELNAVTEAEAFLRDGLRLNPGSPEILYELGRIHREQRGDVGRARNLWEAAIVNWHIHEGEKSEPNTFLLAQITSQLAALEEEQQRFTMALQHLRTLRAVSAYPPAVEKWTMDVWQKLAAKEAAHSSQNL